MVFLDYNDFINLPFIKQYSYNNTDDKHDSKNGAYDPNQAFFFVCNWLGIKIHWHNRFRIWAGGIHRLEGNRRVFFNGTTVKFQNKCCK